MWMQQPQQQGILFRAVERGNLARCHAILCNAASANADDQILHDLVNARTRPER